MEQAATIERPDINDLEFLRGIAGGKSLEDLRRKMPVGGRVIYTGEPRPLSAEQEENLRRANRESAKPKAAPSQINLLPDYKQEMDYLEARRKLADLFEERRLEIEKLKNEPFQWEWSNNLAETVRGLVRFFINDPESPIPLSKWLFVFGNVGTTKTETMRIFQKFAAENRLTKRFEWTNMEEFYTDAIGNDDALVMPCQFNRCFDELGAKSGSVKIYGNPVDLNEEIILRRYKKAKASGQLSIFITNFDSAAVAEMFGAESRAFDRMRELVHPVHFLGESKRKPQ
jgi:hypothetical protein